MDSSCSELSNKRPILEDEPTFSEFKDVAINALPKDEESFNVAIDALLKQSKGHLHWKHKIARVPLLLRNSASNSTDYNPRMVSIGPYHHAKPELQAAEKLKPVIANLIAPERSKILYEFYSLVLPRVTHLKSHYEKGSTNKYSDEDFATMMLWDGCLVLAMIEACTSLTSNDAGQKYKEEIQCLGNHAFGCFISDALFLMENQLPFEVLQLLMMLKYEDGGMSLMSAFVDEEIYWNYNPNREIKVDVKSTLEEEQPIHLLELLTISHRRINFPNKQWISSSSTQKYSVQEMYSYFRSISELKAKGIFVKCSNSPLATSIKFKYFFFFGVLYLPYIAISPESRIFISNYIAYELSRRDTDLITAKTMFMKSLINTSNDVKELRSRRILINEKSSSDEEVVSVISSITICTTSVSKMYEKVRDQIEDHCNSKVKKWMAELIYKNLNSPWAFIAFLAGIVVVVMTCIQAYFAAFPQ
ncbi:hypothetical protein NMG60_11003444 [Bertholletia excelsa]